MRASTCSGRETGAKPTFERRPGQSRPAGRPPGSRLAHSGHGGPARGLDVRDNDPVPALVRPRPNQHCSFIVIPTIVNTIVCNVFSKESKF